MKYQSLIKSTILDSIETKQKVLESNREHIEKAALLCIETLQKGGTLYFCGNGGSSSDASHIAAELVVRYKGGNERKALPAIALNADSGVLTACGNDYGYEHVFRRQVEAFGKPGDLFFGITTSGNSANIILALEEAKKIGLKSILLLGGTGGKLKGEAEVEIIVPSNVTARIQESHIMIGHIICSIIEKDLFGLD
ncbi:phosphoheptose isomerase [Leptospira ryugenii]|uniref:Phosphoheptose isomerase n=1 Tax=Leptospira ryugenii TaxID=1917863 RepID=A0A2P2DWM8_9LEPT|nr:D-sedoheptulose 7-phosphate isomerase [Leptospira ryugenii]GBF49017.1 phosphoheptose isomerase [Leptospira ryugenii]